MTPELKAQELIEKFGLLQRRGVTDLTFKEVELRAKQCAAICVENIVNECKFISGVAEYRLQYWDQVLNEIKQSV